MRVTAHPRNVPLKIQFSGSITKVFAFSGSIVDLFSATNPRVIWTCNVCPVNESFTGSPHGNFGKFYYMKKPPYLSKVPVILLQVWGLPGDFLQNSHWHVTSLKVFLTSIRTLLLGWECWLASLGGNAAVKDKPWWWARANVPGRKQAWSKDKVFSFIHKLPNLQAAHIQFESKIPMLIFSHQFNKLASNLSWIKKYLASVIGISGFHGCN